jgi:hypothetical protein
LTAARRGSPSVAIHAATSPSFCLPCPCPFPRPARRSA